MSLTLWFCSGAVHTMPVVFEKRNNYQFGFVFEEKLGQGNHINNVMLSFSKGSLWGSSVFVTN